MANCPNKLSSSLSSPKSREASNLDEEEEEVVVVAGTVVVEPNMESDSIADGCLTVLGTGVDADIVDRPNLCAASWAFLILASLAAFRGLIVVVAVSLVLAESVNDLSCFSAA